MYNQYKVSNVTMSFCHPPRDVDVTPFGDWRKGLGGQNKTKIKWRVIERQIILAKEMVIL